MKTKTIIIGLSTTLVCLAASAPTQPRAAGGGFAERFQRFDKNADGKLTREEFPAAKIFDAADADKDGRLTREEVAAYFRKQQSSTPTSPKPSTTPAPVPVAKVDIVQTLNVPYATVPGVDANLLSLDIHAPKGAKNAPVVVYVHGGYWQAGDKSQKGHLPDFFCRQGFVFVSVNYRLAPAVQHPVLVQDVARAVAWVHDHIAEQGGDPSQIFLTGHSAGAQLVALLGTDAKRLGEHGKPLSILRAVIPLDSAAMDIRDVAANDRRADSPYRAAFGNEPAAWADASPLVHAQRAKSPPPFQIVVAYGPAIANKKAGVDEFAATLPKNGTRAEVVDASSFREHQSLMTEFGAAGDPVSAAVLEFIESVRSGKPVAGLGSERVLKPEGEAAAAAAKQLEAYRLRVLMRQFDKNKDGRIIKDEMSANRFLFERMDANKDGIVTADELGAYTGMVGKGSELRLCRTGVEQPVQLYPPLALRRRGRARLVLLRLRPNPRQRPRHRRQGRHGMDLQSNPEVEPMKTIVTLFTLSAILVCLPASAQMQQRAADGGLAERFKQLDRDGDGKVSREEGGSLPFFDAADKNKDGFLTIEEVQAYFAARRKTRPAASEEPAAPLAAGELTAVDVVFELCVRDAEACAEFYRDVIGMREVEPGALLEWAGSYLRLRKIAGEKPAPATGNPMKQMLSQNGFRWFSLWFNNPAAISERLVKAGYPAPMKGGNVSMTRDPDGNVVEIMGVPRSASSETFTWGMAVSDEAAARKFYGETLGLQAFAPWNLPPPLSMKMYLFATGAGRVKSSAPQGQRPRESEAGPDAPGLRSVTLRVTDLAAAREGLRKRGAKIEGDKRLLVTDPDGNRIYIEQAPPEAIRAAASRPKTASTGTPSRQSLQDRIRAQYGNITPKPHKEEVLSQRPGEPPLKKMPDCDATRDAAGHDTLFKSICVAGLTEIQEGMNGVAIVELNKDGRLDIVATYSAPGVFRKWGEGDKLRVFINDGGFEFHRHAIKLLDSKVSPERFGRSQVPVLADFNGDGFLDLFVSRHAQMQGGQSNPRDEKLGNGLYISDGTWDVFRDVSVKMGIQNEQAYNRQPSIADVNEDGWLDIAVGCDNIKNAQGGFPHSRLYVFTVDRSLREREGLSRSERSTIPGHFVDIGGTALVPDFGGFYHDSAKDKAGPDVNLRDLDNDGDLDLIQSYHVDVLDLAAPYSPIEYRQGVFCWNNLLAETGKLQFEKITGNGLACEAHLKLSADKQSTEPVGKAPGLPYISVADADNDGLLDVLAVGPASPGWAPRAEYVSGRFWRNKGNIQFQEATDAAGLSALNWVYRDWCQFFEAPQPQARPGAPIAPGDRRPYFADAVFGDYDNDGWVDFVVLDRHESPNREARAILFMNRGDGTFEPNPTTFSGLDGSGICGEAADLNNDGLLDLVLAADPDNSGVVISMDRYESKVYWNTGAQGARSNHWLRLRFSGVTDAELIGARVELLECGDLSPLSLSPDSASKSARTDPLGGSSPREIQSGDKSPHSKRQYRWMHPNHSSSSSSWPMTLATPALA